MTPESESKEPKQKAKKGKVNKKDEELFIKTKELLEAKIKQINTGLDIDSTSIGADIYTIFPIDED